MVVSVFNCCSWLVFYLFGNLRWGNTQSEPGVSAAPHVQDPWISCRGANIPEPLARVLEPVSVRHLDSEGGGIIVEPVRRLARHGSMEGEDPGVIGPLVWDVHCHRVHHQGSELWRASMPCIKFSSQHCHLQSCHSVLVHSNSNFPAWTVYLKYITELHNYEFCNMHKFPLKMEFLCKESGHH